MSERSQFDLGLAAGSLAMVGASAVYWFITPHADAGTVRRALVAMQLIAGFASAGWLRYRYRRTENPR